MYCIYQLKTPFWLRRRVNSVKHDTKVEIVWNKSIHLSHWLENNDFNLTDQLALIDWTYLWSIMFYINSPASVCLLISRKRNTTLKFILRLNSKLWRKNNFFKGKDRQRTIWVKNINVSHPCIVSVFIYNIWPEFTEFSSYTTNKNLPST